MIIRNNQINSHKQNVSFKSINEKNQSSSFKEKAIGISFISSLGALGGLAVVNLNEDVFFSKVVPKKSTRYKLSALIGAISAPVLALTVPKFLKKSQKGK